MVTPLLDHPDRLIRAAAAAHDPAFVKCRSLTPSYVRKMLPWYTPAWSRLPTVRCYWGDC